MHKKLNIGLIRIDGGTQARESINQEAVQEYAEAIAQGATFPPVTIFFDGAEHWLADGFHRYHAHRHAGRVSIDADVREGTVREAVLFSFSANDGHGLRTTPADRRKAMLRMLNDPEWSQWSDSAIAKASGVSQQTVANHRRSIFQNLEDSPPKTRKVERGGKVYEQDTTKIGRQTAPGKLRRDLDPMPEELRDYDPKEDDLKEAALAVTQLAEENEQLRTRLAIEAMDASEEEKTEAAETIATLRERVRQLEIELDAVKASRDGFMRENGELKRQCEIYQRALKKAEKAGA